MKRNGLIKKIAGGFLALAFIAAMGMGSSSTASAAGFDHGRYFVAERHYRAPFFPRYRFEGRFFHPRCWR
ncbi:MAG TPA: hypothetical protein VI756_12185 [Blastocatellia bacterium]